MQVIFRKQAIDFQRRRLAGDVNVLPKRRTAIAATLVVAAVVACCSLAWGWSVDVEHDVACGISTDANGLSLDTAALTRGATVVAVEQLTPVARHVDVGRVVVGTHADMARGCTARVRLIVHPVREALLRAYLR